MISKKKLSQRAEITQGIRDFFINRGFLEVNTPALVPQPSLEPYLNPLDLNFTNERGQVFAASLITSPEYSLKKLLAIGLGSKIFEICKVWRGGEAFGGLHNPEFTMLEWYHVGVDYRVIMEETEQLIFSLAKASSITYQGKEIELTLPWTRMSMREAWQKYAGVELNDFLERDRMAELARQKGHSVSPSDSFDDLFFKIFLDEIESKLMQSVISSEARWSRGTPDGISRPLFLYDYPKQMAALARLSPADPRYAERFELYLGGLELANAFSELTDPAEQRARLLADQQLRRQLGKKVYPIDESFVAALEAGLPECAGIALGVERLVMILTDSRRIEEVITFPASELFAF